MHTSPLSEHIKKAKSDLAENMDATPFTLYRLLHPIMREINACLDNISSELSAIASESRPIRTIESGLKQLSSLKRLTEILAELKADIDALTELNDLTLIKDGADFSFMENSILIDTKSLLQKLNSVEQQANQLKISCLLQKDYLMYSASEGTIPYTTRHMVGHQLQLCQGDTDNVKDMYMSLAEDIYTLVGKEAFTNPKLKPDDLNIISAITMLDGQETCTPEVNIELKNREEERPIPDHKDKEESIPEHEEQEEMDTILLDPDTSSSAATDTDKTEAVETQTQTITAPTLPEKTSDTAGPAGLTKKTITHQEYNVFKKEYETAKKNYVEAIARQKAIQTEIGDMSTADQDQTKKYTQTVYAVRETHEKLKAASDRLEELNNAIRNREIIWEKKVQRTQPQDLQRKPNPIS